MYTLFMLDVFRPIILFVEKGPQGDILRSHGADPADSVVLSRRLGYCRFQNPGQAQDRYVNLIS